MKFCVNITSGPLAGTLEDDNLRGEGRWERQVARGLVRTGEPVGTPLPKWGGDSPNWIGHITDLSDCAYVTIYGGLERIPTGASAYLLQFFSVANAPIEEELRVLMGRVGRRHVFVTHSYPSDGCDEIAEDLRDRVALLPPPIEDPVVGDATEKTVLFHPSRNTMESLFSDGGEMLRFVRRALLKNSRLTFETVSGTYDYSGERIWSQPGFEEALGDLRSRVTVHPALTGPRVGEVYARTRLVVCPSGYGGPPLESARYGVPVIAMERDCSLYSAPYTPGFPELPRLGVDGTLVSILERLLDDAEYARRVGDAGRRYVAEHYGQAAFERALGGILERL